MTRRDPTFLLTFLVASMLTLPAWAQRGGEGPNRPPAEVRGQVRLANNQIAPVGIAVLLIHREGDMVSQTQTDSSGKFEFRFIEPTAIYRVRIHSPGYLDYESEDLYLTQTPMAYLNPVLRLDPSYRSPFAKSVPGGVVSAGSLAVPDEARKALDSGKELLGKGSDYDKAIELFKSALQTYPKYSEAYLMMGLAYRAQNKLGDADSALRKCIQIDPNSTAAYFLLGEMQNDEKDYSGAEKSLLKGLSLFPDSPQGHVELARTYWAMGRWQDADPHATRALALAPSNAPAHLIMGNIDLRKRDGQAALQQFQEYLKLEPQGTMAGSVRDLVVKLEKALAEQQQPAR